MSLRPLRLSPGDDVRRALEAMVGDGPGIFVVCGIGSLKQARLRLAGNSAETSLGGPLEIVSLAGSVSRDGAHLHMAVADGSGRVGGGHAGYGNVIRTTAELMIAEPGDWEIGREFDPRTGYKELSIRSRPDRT